MSGAANAVRRAGRGVTVGLLLWALAEFAFGAVVGAHIETDPAEVTADQSVTVQFTVQHGCGGSPTIELAFSVPGGVSDMKGVAKDGWQITNAADTVTFRGGRLDAHTVDQFGLTFTPTAAGLLPFPMMQTCRSGELAWISIRQEGQQEPDYPAPMVQVLAGASTSTGSATATSTGAITPITDSDHTATTDQDDETADTTAVSLVAAPISTVEYRDGLSTTFSTVAALGALLAAGVVTVVVGVRMARRSS